MHRGRIAAPWLLLLAIASCSPGEPPRAPEPEEMQQYAARSEDVRGEYERFVLGWLNAYNRRDVDTLLTLYRPDAIRMPPGAPAQRGMEAIGEGLRDTFRRLEEFVSEGASQEVHFLEGWAVERGSYTLTARVPAEAEPMVQRGKYVVVARRDERGVWRILWEIWNANTPEPEPVPAPDSARQETEDRRES